jgi:hypothetical protein
MEGVQRLLVCIRKFRSTRLATLAPSEVHKRFKTERAAKPKPVTHAKPAGTTATAVAVRVCSAQSSCPCSARDADLTACFPVLVARM